MITIVDYGMGNLASIKNMIEHIGGSAVISSEPNVIAAAEKMILPGVGAFDSGMAKLRERGLVDIVRERALEKQIPVLGICLGMQLMTQGSEEGVLPGLGWFDATTVRFHFDQKLADSLRLKVPHMGWNEVRFSAHPLFAGLEPQRTRFYFVHAYHVVCRSESQIIGTTTFGYEFASAIARANIMGVQYHPEKSHKYGMKLLKNFLSL